MRARSGPTLEHLVLANRLRELRERAGLSVNQAAAEIGVHSATVRRLEQATTAPDAGQITGLLQAYGVGAAVRLQVEQSLAAATRPGWWHRYRAVLTPWERDIIGMESAATLVRIWDPGLVPDLLRTPAYTGAALPPGAPAAALRQDFVAERQRRLAERGAVLWVVMPESALHASVGGPAVMREQHAALAAAAQRPHTTVQVVPAGAPPHSLTGSPALTLLRVGHGQIPDQLVLHGPHGAPHLAAVHDSPATVALYRQLLDGAATAATGPHTPLPLPLSGTAEEDIAL